MLRKLACVGVLFALGVGLVMAEEFNVQIKKIDGDKITAIKGAKFNKDAKKFEGGSEVTLTAAPDVKVMTGKKNKDTKKTEAGDAIEGGLKNERFTKIGENGIGAQVTTNDDGKVTQILVFGGKKKKDAN
jgi:hypothetical protein